MRLRILAVWVFVLIGCSLRAAPDPNTTYLRPDAFVNIGGGNFAFVSKTDKCVYTWSSNTWSFGATISFAETPEQVAYSSALNRLYVGFQSGVIQQVRLDLGETAPVAFATLSGPVWDLLPFGNRLLVVHGQFYLENQSVLTATGTVQSTKPFSTRPRDVQWDAANNRIFGITDTSLWYQTVDVNGTISTPVTVALDNFYLSEPIRISSDGSRVITGHRNVYSVSTGTKATLSEFVADSAFAGSQIGVVAPLGPSATLWNASYAKVDELSLPALPWYIFHLSAKRFMVFGQSPVAHFHAVVDFDTRQVLSGPVITSAPGGGIFAPFGRACTLTVTALGTGNSFQWYKNGVAITGATQASFVLPSITTADNGSYNVKVTNAYGSTATSPVLVTGYNYQGPVVESFTTSQTLSEGQSIQLQVTASGVGVSYQWFRNTSELVGTNSPTLVIPNAKLADAGDYFCRLTNSFGTNNTDLIPVVVNASTVVTQPEAPTTPVVSSQRATVTNLSTRMYVGSNDAVAIAGFSIEGTSSRRVLVRAAGPALTKYVGTGALSDPKVEVIDASNRVMGENGDWSTSLAPEIALAGAFPFEPNSKDSALILTLPPGGYTAVVSAQTGGPGTALVEVYDLSSETSSRLVNLSTRAQVKQGGNIAIAGFRVSGDKALALVIRGAGPALSGFGVRGVLADPTIKLITEGGVVVTTNDNWSSDLASVFPSIGAFAWPLASKDSALRVTLSPGNYTVHLEGASPEEGVGLVEVYQER